MNENKILFYWASGRDNFTIGFYSTIEKAKEAVIEYAGTPYEWTQNNGVWVSEAPYALADIYVIVPVTDLDKNLA